MVGKKAQTAIPEKHLEQFLADLGTDTDAAIAAKWTRLLGEDIARHVPFWARKARGIPSFKPRPYTNPGFWGRIEDKHPEIQHVLGKVTVQALARHYKVSRSCIRSAAIRLGIDPRANSAKTLDELLASYG